MPKVFDFSVFRKELRRSVPSLLLWFLISGILLVGSLLFFASVSKSDFAERMQETLSVFPEELLAGFHLDFLPELSQFTTYFALTAHALFIIGSLYACYRGCVSMAKLESSQSIVLLYSQPVSRVSILLSEFCSQVSLLALYDLGLYFISLFFAGRQKSLDFSGFSAGIVKLFLSYLVIQLLYLSAGFLISVFLTHSSQASAAAFAVILATVLAGFVGEIVHGLGWMGFLAPFHYLDTGLILASSLGGEAYGLFSPLMTSAGLAVVFLALACVRYYRKDFNV